MGFSIGSLLGGIAPILGGVLGGPVGAAIGGVVGGAISSPSAPRPAALQTPSAFARSFLPSSVGPSVQPVAGLRLPRATLAFSSIEGVSQLLKISRDATGQAVTRQKVADAVKHCGIPMAAEIFSLSESEICQIVISKRRRRSRGISAVDLRRTRSTIRKVHNIQHDLKRLSPAVRRHHK